MKTLLLSSIYGKINFMVKEASHKRPHFMIPFNRKCSEEANPWKQKID